jgi:polysaccharide pyruvyl transferase WcaK-like protein
LRDESSKKLIESLGVSGQHFVFPDLAYSLQIEKRIPVATSRTFPPIVGINPVPFSDPEYWPGSSSHSYKSYISKLAEFALWLIQRGYAVLFFPTQLFLDPPVINDIRAIMKSSGDIDHERHIVDLSINSFDNLISAISMTNIVVAARFHGIIISYILNKPVLGIAYQKKTLDLMKQLNQAKYTLDINSFNVLTLQELFISIELDIDSIKEEIRKKVSLFQRSLDIQYDSLFRTLEQQ